MSLKHYLVEEKWDKAVQKICILLGSTKRKWKGRKKTRLGLSFFGFCLLFFSPIFGLNLNDTFIYLFIYFFERAGWYLFVWRIWLLNWKCFYYIGNIYIYNNTVGQHASTNFVFPCQTIYIYIYIYIYIEHGGIISGWKVKMVYL